MVLGNGLKLDGSTPPHEILNADFDELVERIQLLPDQSFLLEVCVYDEPACCLPLFSGKGLLQLVIFEFVLLEVGHEVPAETRQNEK